MKWTITHNISFRDDILRACEKTTPDSPVGVMKGVMQANRDWAKEEIAKLGKNRLEYLKASLWGGENVPEPGERFPVGGYPNIPPGGTPLPDAYKDVIKGPKYIGKNRWEITIGDAKYLDEATRFGGKSELANLGIWRFFEYGKRIFRPGEGEWWFIYSPGKGKFGQGYLITRKQAPASGAKRKQVQAQQAGIRPKPVLQTIYFKLNWRLQRQIEEGFEKVKLGRPGFAFQGRLERGGMAAPGEATTPEVE